MGTGALGKRPGYLPGSGDSEKGSWGRGPKSLGQAEELAGHEGTCARVHDIFRERHMVESEVGGTLHVGRGKLGGVEGTGHTPRVTAA